MDAERGAADDLCLDAGGMCCGLPVLYDGAIGTDSEFNGRRNCGPNFITSAHTATATCGDYNYG